MLIADCGKKNINKLHYTDILKKNLKQYDIPKFALLCLYCLIIAMSIISMAHFRPLLHNFV